MTNRLFQFSVPHVFCVSVSSKTFKFVASPNSFTENTAAQQEFTPAVNISSVNIFAMSWFSYERTVLCQVLASYKN